MYILYRYAYTSFVLCYVHVHNATQLSSYAEKIRVVQEAVCKVHQIRTLQKHNSEVRMIALPILLHLHACIMEYVVSLHTLTLTCNIAVGTESA